MQPTGGTSKISSVNGAVSFTPALEIVSGTVTDSSFAGFVPLQGSLTVDAGATFKLNSGVTVAGDVTINGTAAGQGASLDASGSSTGVNFTNTASPAYGTIDQTRTLTLTGTNTGDNILATGQWYHVAATLEDASGRMSLYTNGSLAAQITTTIRPRMKLPNWAPLMRHLS